ncbi:MAG TPA: peptidase M23 [Leucothrix mucor]|uniref:Peptidase M23 n=1 Tax=Leucothrix mucor TaxID=45248 RepID=A0A7V2WV43_LEUMU|nr:peptidase M23 [Leucothrix mucor]
MLLKLPTKLLASVLVLFLMLITTSSFADNQQQKIKKQIKQVSSSLHTAQSRSNKLSNEVNGLEKNLSDISKSQYRTEKKMENLGKKLAQASIEKQQLLASIDEQKEALAQQMQALYTSGEQSHLRLLLKQDDPSDIGRTIKYFEYLNRSRLNKIKTIHISLQQVKQIEQKIADDRIKLTGLKGKLSTQKNSLNKTLKKREKSLGQAKKQVANKASKLKKLKQQEARLSRVIASFINKQKKAEKAKKKRLKQKNKSAQSRKQIAKASKKPKGKVVTASKFTSSRPFSSLRGRLSWPVRGRMIHRYGSKRNAKQRWRGVVIEAPGGRKVRAVARGKVEFAGRLNGYGYLIIIRHDKSYRSLYAYNRAIYKRTGQTVNAGEVIAAVGNSGGQAKNALYFEIRRGTRLQNPSRWCR